jgi:hypothetical protein
MKSNHGNRRTVEFVMAAVAVSALVSVESTNRLMAT